MLKQFTRSEKSWIFYDWANSAYATIIMAAVFPIYFTSAAKAAGVPGDIWWGYASSISSAAIAVSAPALGAVGDFRGMKKRMFSIFLAVGLCFTLLMAVTNQPMLMLIGYAVSFVGFDGANLFYDSFLTDVTTRVRMDKVSAYGYAYGYIGGSTIPFVISIILIMFGKHFGIGSALAVKISVVICCVWWSLFSIPIFRNVKQTHYVETPPSQLAAGAMRNLKSTAISIFGNRRLLFFMLAYFFYIDGVGTVITMSTTYGSTLGLGSTGMILALLVTQILAFPFSILFGRLSEKIGTLRMIRSGIVVYLLICIVGFYMGFSLEPSQKAYENAFTQTVNSSGVQLNGETLSSIKTEGIAVLSKPDRVAEFNAIVTKESASADANEKTELIKLKTNVDTFLADGGKSADYDRAIGFSTILFWILAILVSTSQGGIQALSRSYFGKLIPASRSNENFGFFDIFGKFATVMGPALYSFISSLTGRSSIGIISLVLLFAVGSIFISACEAAGKVQAELPAETA